MNIEQDEAPFNLDRGRLLEEILEDSPVVVFRWGVEDAQERLIFISGNVSRYGYSQQALLEPGGFAAMLHPNDLQKALAKQREFRASGEEQMSQEYRIVSPQGREFWVEEKTAVSFDSAGVGQYYQGVLLDITTRKQIAINLEKKRARLDEAGRLAGIGAWEFDVAGASFHWSSQARKLFEPAGEKLPDLSIATRSFTGEDQARFRALWLRAIEQAEPFDLELALTPTTGKPMWVRISGKPIMEAGQVIALRGMLQDLTEHRHRKLQTTRNNSIVAASPVLLVAWRDEPGWPIEYVSPNVDRFGYSPAYFADNNLSITELVHPDDQAKLLARINEVNDPSFTVGSSAYRIFTRDGAIRWVEGYVRSPDRNTDGEDCYQALLFDVTDRVIAELAQSRLQRALHAHIGAIEIIINASDEAVMLTKICQLLVDVGHYASAWICQGAGDTHQYLSLVASAGEDMGGDELAQLSLSPGAPDFGPSGHTVLTQQPFLYAPDSDTAASIAAEFPDWSRWAKGHEFTRFTALPILHDSQSLGCICLLEKKQFGIADDELKLLRELAMDVGYGLNSLRTHQQNEDKTERLANSLVQTVYAIAKTMEMRDPYTAGHMNRVAYLATAIAREMGLAEERIRGLELACMVHDLGKVYVPAEILNRPGKLGVAELEMVRGHSEVGYDILKDIAFDWPIKEMVLQHHERLDGSGYPHGIKAEEMLLESQIMAVADVFEAMNSHRPYRPALSVEVTLEELRKHSGTHYNAEAVAICELLFTERGFDLADAAKADWQS